MDTLTRALSDLQRIRALLAFFVVALVISGATAIPLEAGSRLLLTICGPGTWLAGFWPPLGSWIGYVAEGIAITATRYPFMFYGTDWLAFGHFAIAIAFLGPLRDPLRNVWVVEFGIIVSLLVIPMALIFGPLRNIPFWWRLVDCSFGIGGLVVLLPAYRLIRRQV